MKSPKATMSAFDTSPKVATDGRNKDLEVVEMVPIPTMTYKMPLNRTSTAALKIRKSFKKL